MVRLRDRGGLVKERLRIAVAMSGGVDSSVAAAILKQQGHEVMGITMEIWPPSVDEDQRCSRAAKDARSVADKLGIPHYVVNVSQDFETIIDYFCREYLEGKTPNPCVMCNRLIKFDALVKEALALGATHIATGHYARVSRHPLSGRFLLKKGCDPSKDQSYALWSLDQAQLGSVIFPLGAMAKRETRRVASSMGLQVARKAESQEICFVQGNYADFIRRRFPEGIVPGPILDLDGRRLGTHKGTPLYTVGQRRGLGISASEPLYVVEVRAASNALVVGPSSALVAVGLRAVDVNFFPFPRLESRMDVSVRVRYNASEVSGQIEPSEEGVLVTFSEPERAVTPGQSVVFYQEDLVIGGGIIKVALSKRGP